MGYKINDIKYDYNSLINQKIKSDYVRQNVYYNVSSMVEYILKKSWEDADAPFCYDDIINLNVQSCPECCTENRMEEVDLLICSNCFERYDAFEDVCPTCESDGISDHFIEYECQSCNHLAEESDIDIVQQEVYEWWIISDWLANKLKANGEVIILHENIWGRTCTGQVISLDEAISDICYSLGILEGQEYEREVA